MSGTKEDNTRECPPEAAISPRVPNREERQQCWAARDQFFSCLDTHRPDDPSPSDCAELRRRLYAACPAVWVSASN